MYLKFIELTINGAKETFRKIVRPVVRIFNQGETNHPSPTNPAEIMIESSIKMESSSSTVENKVTVTLPLNGDKRSTAEEEAVKKAAYWLACGFSLCVQAYRTSNEKETKEKFARLQEEVKDMKKANEEKSQELKTMELQYQHLKINHYIQERYPTWRDYLKKQPERSEPSESSQATEKPSESSQATEKPSESSQAAESESSQATESESSQATEKPSESNQAPEKPSESSGSTEKPSESRQPEVGTNEY